MYGDADFLPIVLGTGLNTYGIARAMHEAYGVRTLAIGRAALHETANSALLDVRVHPDLHDPNRVLDVLGQVASEFPDRKRLLIANIELYTNIVMRHRDELSKQFIVPNPDAALGSRLMNKTDFYRTCAQLGVPHPETVVADRETFADPAFGTALPFDYPVIVKPSDTDLYPRLRFAGSKKVYLVKDATELRATGARIYGAGYEGDIIVQEYLAGDESVMRVVNTYSDRFGRMRFLSAAQIVLGVWNPSLVGNYNAVLTMHDPALTESIRTLLDSVGYVGAANFDVMYDPRTGTSKLLEINLRQGAASYYTAAAGGNLARCYVEDLVHERELPEQVTTDERLWVNVPYPLVSRLAPRTLVPRVRQARTAGVTHTLRYPADRGLRRLMTVARVDLRHSRSYWTFRAARPRGAA